jgi:hypothetical protein
MAAKGKMDRIREELFRKNPQDAVDLERFMDECPCHPHTDDDSVGVGDVGRFLCDDDRVIRGMVRKITHENGLIVYHIQEDPGSEELTLCCEPEKC